jgi:hypothetical protein
MGFPEFCGALQNNLKLTANDVTAANAVQGGDKTGCTKNFKPANLSPTGGGGGETGSGGGGGGGGGCYFYSDYYYEYGNFPNADRTSCTNTWLITGWVCNGVFNGSAQLLDYGCNYMQ